jgi:hypothetical protein
VYQANPGDSVTVDVFIENVPLDLGEPSDPSDDVGGLTAFRYFLRFDETVLGT